MLAGHEGGKNPEALAIWSNESCSLRTKHGAYWTGWGWIMKHASSIEREKELRHEEAIDAVVEQVVRKLNIICRDATLEFALCVGKLIIDSFYSGDLAAWRGRGTKTVSFRKLARHPDLPMSATALYRSTAIYELCRRLEIDSWKHVSTSHLRVVLPLPPGEQAALLRVVEAERWPVQRLREEIEGLPLALPRTRGGRKRRSSLRKTLGILAACLDESNKILDRNCALDPDLSPDSVRSIVQLIRRVQTACASLENRVQRSVYIVPQSAKAPACAGDDEGDEVPRPRQTA